MQLDALERSVSRTPKILPLSNAFFHFFNNAKKNCCILKSFEIHTGFWKIYLKNGRHLLEYVSFTNFDRVSKILTSLEFCFASFFPSYALV